MSRGLVTLVICTSLLFGGTDTLAKSIEERNWIRMESEHFVVHSVLTRRSTTDLLKHLEVVYALFLGAAERSTASEVPTIIFALGGVRDMEAIGWNNKNAVGFFVPGLQRNIVVIREQKNADEASTMVHEFVHYLLYNNARFPFPKWYHEGYAEYISANAMGKSYFDVGRIQQGRSWALESNTWLPLDEIIDPSHYRDFDEKEINLFYAQAWLLVHYLYSQPDGQALVSQGLRRYAQSLDNGNSYVAAFEEGFGYTLDELEKELRSYKNRGRFQYARFPLDILLKEFNPVETRMSKEEISLELGSLLIDVGTRRGVSDEDLIRTARRFFDIAAASPATRARAGMGIGYLLHLAGQTDEAESWIVSSAALSPNDYRVQLDAAMFFLGEIFEGNAEALAQAEPHLLRAANLDKTRPEFALAIGLFLLHQGDVGRAVGAIESAAKRAPADQDTRLLLAVIYARTGNTQRALDVAKDVLQFAHGSGGNARAAQKLIDELEGGHQDPSSESDQQ